MPRNETESLSEARGAGSILSWMRYNSTWKVVLTVTVILVVVLFEYADRDTLGHSLSGFIGLGSRFMHPDELPAGIHHVPGPGHEGQFSYFVARDPLILEDMHEHMDLPLYRYQRIGYPMLVTILSLGIDTLIPVMLVVVNVLAIVIGTMFVALVLRKQRMSEWYALFYGLLSGLLIATARDFSAPVAMCFTVIAMFYYGSRNFWLSAVFLALAILCHEIVVALVPVLVLDAILTGKERRAMLLQVAALLPFATWKLYVATTLRQGTGNTPRGILGKPFLAMYDHVRYMLKVPNDIRGLPEKLYLFLFVVVVLVSAAYALREILRSHNEISMAFLGFSLMPFLVSHRVWAEPWAYGRILVPGAVFLVLSFARSKDRWYLLPLSGHALLFLVTMEWLSIW